MRKFLGGALATVVIPLAASACDTKASRPSPDATASSADMAIVASTPVNVSSPMVVGDFRIVYPGDPQGPQLRYARPPKDVSKIVDPSIVEKSDLYALPTHLPAGLKLTSEDATVGDGEVIGIDLYFSYDLNGQQAGLQVTRWKGLSLPVDIEAPIAGGVLSLEQGTVGAMPAIFVKSSPKIPQGNDIWFSRDGIVTFLRGTGPFDELKAIAESLP